MYVRGLLIACAASVSAVATAAEEARPMIGPFALGSAIEDAKRAAPAAKWEAHADKASGRLVAISAADAWSFDKLSFRVTLRPNDFGTRLLRFEAADAVASREECQQRAVAVVAHLEEGLGEFGPGPASLGWGSGDATVGAGALSQVAVTEEFGDIYWQAESLTIEKPNYVVVTASFVPSTARCTTEISATTRLPDQRAKAIATKQFASDLAEHVERLFVAEFKDPDAARAAWRREGNPVLRQVAEHLFPTPAPEEFAAEAIAAVRAKRAAEPSVPLETLVATALNPRGDGVAVVRLDPNERAASRTKTQPDVTMRPLKDTAVLKIPILAEKTPRQVQAALATMPARLIVDLRGNRGGLFDTIARTAEAFLQPSAVVVSVASHDGTEDYITSGSGGERRRVALIVLIDEDTNAGALALAAALVDHAKAKLAGRLAKQVNGTLYSVVPLVSERGKAMEGYVRIPTGVLKRPNGALLADGLTLDLPISATGEAAVAEAVKAFK
jgi:hypothetical protein